MVFTCIEPVDVGLAGGLARHLRARPVLLRNQPTWPVRNTDYKIDGTTLADVVTSWL